MDRNAHLRPEGTLRARIPAGLVGFSVASGAVAHVAAALTGPAGVMGWLMAAMGAACLGCAAPMAGRGRCAARAAGHLLAMSAAMILIHLVLLATSGAASHHGGAHSSAGTPGHAGAMLVLIAVELACLMGAAVALRLSRAATSTTKEQP